MPGAPSITRDTSPPSEFESDVKSHPLSSPLAPQLPYTLINTPRLPSTSSNGTSRYNSSLAEAPVSNRHSDRYSPSTSLISAGPPSTNSIASRNNSTAADSSPSYAKSKSSPKGNDTKRLSSSPSRMNRITNIISSSSPLRIQSKHPPLDADEPQTPPGTKVVFPTLSFSRSPRTPSRHPRPPSDSHSPDARRSSAEFSTVAAFSRDSWQRGVAEEMIRLAGGNSSFSTNSNSNPSPPRSVRPAQTQRQSQHRYSHPAPPPRVLIPKTTRSSNSLYSENISVPLALQPLRANSKKGGLRLANSLERKAHSNRTKVLKPKSPQSQSTSLWRQRTRRSSDVLRDTTAGSLNINTAEPPIVVHSQLPDDDEGNGRSSPPFAFGVIDGKTIAAGGAAKEALGAMGQSLPSPSRRAPTSTSTSQAPEPSSSIPVDPRIDSSSSVTIVPQSTSRSHSLPSSFPSQPMISSSNSNAPVLDSSSSRPRHITSVNFADLSDSNVRAGKRKAPDRLVPGAVRLLPRPRKGILRPAAVFDDVDVISDLPSVRQPKRFKRSTSSIGATGASSIVSASAFDSVPAPLSRVDQHGVMQEPHPHSRVQSSYTYSSSSYLSAGGTLSRGLSRASVSEDHHSTDLHSQRRGSITSKMTGHSSLAGSGIPVRALISPRPPSVLSMSQTGAAAFHMHDPTTAKHVQVGREVVPEGGLRWWERMPVHAWLFFLGFLVPFAWWVGSFLRPRGVIFTRVGEEDGGVEEWDDYDHDALIWRFRCRLLSALTLILYIPIIVLAIVFGR